MATTRPTRPPTSTIFDARQKPDGSRFSTDGTRLLITRAQPADWRTIAAEQRSLPGQRVLLKSASHSGNRVHTRYPTEAGSIFRSDPYRAGPATGAVSSRAESHGRPPGDPTLHPPRRSSRNQDGWSDAEPGSRP